MQTNAYKRNAVGIFILAILMLVLTGPLAEHSRAHVQASGFAPVKVINETGDPVPVTGDVVVNPGDGAVPVTGEVSVTADEPVPVEVVEEARVERVTLSASNRDDCTFGTGGDECPTFVSASVSIPEGKQLITETVSILWDVPLGEDAVVPATAMLTGFEPFQRHVVGPTVPIEGLTGADAGASASLRITATGSVNGSVGFTGDRPNVEFVGVDVFVSGTLVDAPGE